MEYYSAMKKDGLMPFAATRMDLEIITLTTVQPWSPQGLSFPSGSPWISVFPRLGLLPRLTLGDQVKQHHIAC